MKYIYIPLCIALFASCDAAKKATEEQTASVETPNTNKLETIDLDYLNKDVRPQDDFFEFSNGSWVKNNPVPPSESRWGSFNELDQANKKKLTTILEEAKDTKAMNGTIMQILGHYYASLINMEQRNAVGVAPIQAELDAIDRINSKKDIPAIIAVHHAVGIHSLFGFHVGQDMKNVDVNVINLFQGGIGLPNRDYYYDEDKIDIVRSYRTFIQELMSTTMGIQRDVDGVFTTSIINFETMLAESMMKPAQMRDPEATYNKMSRQNLSADFGAFDFEAYVQATGIASFDDIIVGQPAFVNQISRMMEEVELQDWKNYLKWKVINHYAAHLTEVCEKYNFDFYGRVLSGKTEMKPINERAINEITGLEIGELLGKAFVGRHFSDAAQQRVNTMVDNLLAVYKDRIQNLDWMSAATKEQALIKLEAIGRKLGFPSKWEDFSSLNIKHDDYIHNVREIARFSRKKNMEKLHKPVDKDEWGMPAHMVNAYYHPLLNEIAFPAGIMQAPFFSNTYEDAVNYGRIGMVIGHEFTHGFDDMGSKFAADGSFNNWWTKADRAAFDDRTSKLGNTFAQFCPIDEHCVNPQLTMGENIADLGGLTMAFHAYQMTDEYKSGVERKGFTPAQRFFIAYAQLWKINYTTEELKNRLANDPHSPGMYRVNGPLMNCPEFFEAFDVKEGDPMRNPEGKVARIW